MAKLRFGMIGAGGIAQAYALAFANNEKGELVAVADTRLPAAQAIAETLGCKAFENHETMCDEMNLDAVIVCTPPISHPDITTGIMKRGLHVLCEKPLAISVDDAQRMIDQASESDVVFTKASKFRYVEDMGKLKSIIESGVLGEVILIENVFTATVDMTNRWNSNPEVSGGGVLIDNGTHSVDIMRYLLGPLSEIQVVEGRRIQDIPVEDTVRVFVRSQGGAIGSIDLSWSLKKEQPYFISVYGSQGTALIGWGESKYKRTSDADWTKIGDGYDKVQAFSSQIDNLVGKIRGEEELLITSADALASVEVIETAYASLNNAQWHAVGPVADERDRMDGSIKTSAGSVS
ncbi:MAG: Gfo/Idh/MocA family protein [Planctomycetaceae bacterium]